MFTQLFTIHNESIKQSINKHLSSACYDINISFLLWKAWNYLCIRSRHHILGIVYLNCFWHIKNKQAIVGEYPLCLRILEQTVLSEATLSSSKRDDKTISTQYSLHKCGASGWMLQLAKKPIEDDSPTQPQDSSTYSPPPAKCTSKIPSHTPLIPLFFLKIYLLF